MMNSNEKFKRLTAL